VSQQIKFFCEKINEYKQHIESENKPGTNLLF
jgi:hypothetical protein